MTPGFEVGKQVVCIKEFDGRELFGKAPRIPQFKEIYTIAAIVPEGYWMGLGPALELEEVGAYFFKITHFRPVKPTSIKDLERLLDVPPSEQPSRLIEELLHAK